VIDARGDFALSYLELRGPRCAIWLTPGNPLISPGRILVNSASHAESTLLLYTVRSTSLRLGTTRVGLHHDRLYQVGDMAVISLPWVAEITQYGVQ
jgi:hypothetical protein